MLSFVVLLIINWARAFRILELGEKGSSSAEGRGKERQQAGSTGDVQASALIQGPIFR